MTSQDSEIMMHSKLCTLYVCSANNCTKSACYYWGIAEQGSVEFEIVITRAVRGKRQPTYNPTFSSR